MIYLKLFLVFLEIGAVSFGGGYGMISLIRELVTANGWLTETEILNFIAVSESTPGPVAVNMATFVGSSQGGFFGALCATLGVVMPSFVIILVIAALIKNLLKYSGVAAFLGGVKPCVAGLITGTAAVIFLHSVLGLGEQSGADFCGAAIFALIAAVSFVWKKIKKKPLSPIVLIIISGVLGVLIYPMVQAGR